MDAWVRLLGEDTGIANRDDVPFDLLPRLSGCLAGGISIGILASSVAIRDVGIIAGTVVADPCEPSSDDASVSIGFR